jgi:hypothetical protein
MAGSRSCGCPGVAVAAGPSHVCGRAEVGGSEAGRTVEPHVPAAARAVLAGATGGWG